MVMNYLGRHAWGRVFLPAHPALEGILNLGDTPTQTGARPGRPPAKGVHPLCTPPGLCRVVLLMTMRLGHRRAHVFPRLMVVIRLLAVDVGAGLAPAQPRAPARGAPTPAAGRGRGWRWWCAGGPRRRPRG